jgi:hypothetical protein
MSDIKQSPVLKFISDKIKTAIADAVLEKISATESIIKDGNDTIQLEEVAGEAAKTTSILITDKKEILYSEDLLEEMQDVYLETESGTSLHEALKATSIVVNNLSIETKFVFQAVKDCFDTLSNSYEYMLTTEKNINNITLVFKFGETKFKAIIANEPTVITIGTAYGSTITPKVKETIEADVVKVQKALNKLFKEN